MVDNNKVFSNSSQSLLSRSLGIFFYVKKKLNTYISIFRLTIIDNLGRTPNEVIPPTLDPDLVPEDAIVTLKDLLRSDSRDEILASPQTSVSGRVLLQSLGLKIGDQIMVSPNKVRGEKHDVNTT